MAERDWRKDWELIMQASPGPWKWSIMDGDYTGMFYFEDGKHEVSLMGVDNKYNIYIEESDARFIAEAREALPYWLERVRELEAESKRLRELLHLAINALRAPTHAINDFNCEDWPIGEGCRGCKGDEKRAEAIRAIRQVLHCLTDKGEGREDD